MTADAFTKAALELRAQYAKLAARLTAIEGRQELLATSLRSFVLPPDAERQFEVEWEALGRQVIDLPAQMKRGT
jgi:hypothetical protein